MAGHGAQILITDGNYSSLTKTKPNVEKVYLNLTPGLVNVTDVLKTLNRSISIEKAEVMEPEVGPEPDIFAEFVKILSKDVKITKYKGAEFYKKCINNDDLCLVIITGEKRIYANILITIGVV